MFDTWLRENPSATWNKVAIALERINKDILASELRHTLCSTSSTVDTPSPSSDDTQEQDPLEELEMVKVEFKKATCS